jgi:hypothetical protein
MKDKLVKLASQQEQMQSIAEMQQNEVKCKQSLYVNFIEQLQLMMRYLGDISGRATSSGGGSGGSAAQQVVNAPASVQITNVNNN